ncbi:MAG: hypothetical protein P1U57_10960 [Oleibacter sp.]|nr:hypothetical protein [Thalassolituus sp.]
MLESQRINYLRSMGITQWMPRTQLPHAAPSRWLPEAKTIAHTIAMTRTETGMRPAAAADLLHDFNEATHGKETTNRNESMSADVNGTSAAAKHAGTASTNALARSQGAPVSANASATHSSVSQSATKPTLESVNAEKLQPSEQPAFVASTDPRNIPRFELIFLNVPDHGLWIVDDAKKLESLQKFIANVMSAMHVPLNWMPQPVIFRWPFIESLNEDQSEAVALQALGAQWQFCKEQGSRYVITCGNGARDWLSRIQQSSHVHIEDLDALKNDASLKRQFWLDLIRVSSK